MSDNDQGIKGLLFDLTGVIQLNPFLFWFFISDLKFCTSLGTSRRIFLDNESENKKDSVKLSLELKKNILKFLRSKKRLNKKLINFIKDAAKHYKVGIVSNHGAGLKDRLKQVIGIDQDFDIVVSSGDWGVEKPNEKIFQIAIEQINLAPAQLIYTDDNDNYVRVAQSLGMEGIIYKNFCQFKNKLNQILSKQKN